jgi:hypothetical protein
LDAAGLRCGCTDVQCPTTHVIRQLTGGDGAWSVILKLRPGPLVGDGSEHTKRAE